MRRLISTLFRDYTTVLVLLALCAVLSIITWDEQHPRGVSGGRQLAALIKAEAQPGDRVLIVVRGTAEDAEFAAALEERLQEASLSVVETVRGQPLDARRALSRLSETGSRIDVIAANQVTAGWGPLQDLPLQGAAVRAARIYVPASYFWPDFLKSGNLLNIANQIAFIAIIAIGMTMVIVSGGIDLSVGSVVALTSMVAARLIRDYGGGVEASLFATAACCLAAIGVGAAVGAFNGALISRLSVPPFIVTLATMSIAGGLAFMVSQSESINQVPDSLRWLSRGTPLGPVPNVVWFMVALYAVAHVIMSRTTLGRYLYAVGGNRRAAWLCGLPVGRVEMTAYAVTGALAGLAGVLMLSQYASASPNYGLTYELQIIAAVVVGGTSLSGGQGTILGTLLGALLIATVQNGMNLMGLSSDPQKVVLGLVILAAAVIDRMKSTASDG